jgi:hypothetical protein
MERIARLPKGFVPALPKRCVGCSAPDPDRRVTLWTMSSSWWVVLLPIVMFFSKATRTTFPACRGCAWRIRFRRMASFAIMMALILVAVTVVFRWLPASPRILRRLVGVGACLVILLPWAAWEAWFPPAVSLTLQGGTVEYEFRDVEFAAEFRSLNRGELRE